MRLSTSTCIHEHVLWNKEMHYTCEESLEACAKAGYRVLDMSFINYSRVNQPMTKPDWADWIKRIKDRAESLNLEFSQAHAHFYPRTGLDTAAIEWNEELIRRSIIAAGTLQSKWIVIHPVSMNDGTWYSHKKSLETNVELYQQYGELAAKYNLGVATENMIEAKNNRRYASSTEELLELVNAINNPMFGVCWDFGHAHLAQIDQCRALREIGANLKALHVADNFGEKDDHIAPYFGTIEWAPIMKTLKEIGYGGDFTYEIIRSVDGLPDEIQAPFLRYTYELGQYMLTLADNGGGDK